MNTLLLFWALLAAPDSPRVAAEAFLVPEETYNEGSGYFSIVEGKDGRLYIGTAKYRENAYLVEFDPRSRAMRIAVDCVKEIGSAATGFAAQSKIHTRNNVGASGRIYFGTKQGYPRDGEKRSDYLGGHPMVYDPATGKTRVYSIPVPHHGIISVTPDEARGVAYISTCSDERPADGTRFMVLDLEGGKYRDLLDCRHMYAFIVLDHRGRAYHPVRGGLIARYDPDAPGTAKGLLERGWLDLLGQRIDGSTPDAASRLADPDGHPINWETSPDRRTLYSVAMEGNALYAYDIGGDGLVLEGKKIGKLLADADATDCRAMCVGADGRVWAAVSDKTKERHDALHVVSWTPGSGAPKDHGLVTIRNPDYTRIWNEEGNPLPHRHGLRKLEDGTLTPLYPMGICAGGDGTAYVTVIMPLTLLAIPPGS